MGRPGHGPGGSGWGCWGHAHPVSTRPIPPRPGAGRQSRRGRRTWRRAGWSADRSSDDGPVGRSGRPGRPRLGSPGECRVARRHGTGLGLRSRAEPAPRPRRRPAGRTVGHGRGRGRRDRLDQPPHDGCAPAQGQVRLGVGVDVRRGEPLELQGPQPRLDPGPWREPVRLVLLVLLQRLPGRPGLPLGLRRGQQRLPVRTRPQRVPVAPRRLRPRPPLEGHEGLLRRRERQGQHLRRVAGGR